MRSRLAPAAALVALLLAGAINKCPCLPELALGGAKRAAATAAGGSRHPPSHLRRPSLPGAPQSASFGTKWALESLLGHAPVHWAPPADRRCLPPLPPALAQAAPRPAPRASGGMRRPRASSLPAFWTSQACPARPSPGEQGPAAPAGRGEGGGRLYVPTPRWTATPIAGLARGMSCRFCLR